MVVSQVALGQTMDYIPVTTSIYADDMCFWAVWKNTHHLVDAIQDSLDQLSTNLRG